MPLGTRIGGKWRVSASVSIDVMIIQIIGMTMRNASGNSTRCHGLKANRWTRVAAALFLQRWEGAGVVADLPNAHDA